MAHSDTNNAATINFNTTRFGEIEVAVNEILHFPEGLLGFNTLSKYILLKDPEQEPFLWMQSVENADLAFVVVDPFIFFPGYEIQVKAQELAGIELKDVSKANILTILTVPEDPMKLTANLRGPIVINPDKSLAKQIVLIDDRYHTRHPLLGENPEHLSQPPLENQEVEENNSVKEKDEQSQSSMEQRTKKKNRGNKVRQNNTKGQ